jgi:hypothetical protein
MIKHFEQLSMNSWPVGPTLPGAKTLELNPDLPNVKAALEGLTKKK